MPVGQYASQIASAAIANGIEPAALLAVTDVETAGKAFEEADKSTPSFLFERHIFYDELQNRAPGKLSAAEAQGLAHKGWRGRAQYADEGTSTGRLALLARARAIDPDCADRCCSWGLGQVMGNNATDLGFPNAEDMVAHMSSGGVAAQLDVMIGFIRHRKGLLEALKRHDWKTFARGYNGEGYAKNNYDAKLAAAYARWARAPAPMAPAPQAPVPDVLAGLSEGMQGDSVRRLQLVLQRLRYYAGDIDGIYGARTRDAVRAFQASHFLNPTGVADIATLRALGLTAPGGGGAEAEASPEEILQMIFEALLKTQAAAPTTSGAARMSLDILQRLLGLASNKTTTAPSLNPASSPLPSQILSPIDKMLGGEALVGKKTALSIVAYVILAIFKAVPLTAQVVGSATPAGQILTVLIMAFGGLGGLAKIDRMIKALGIIAARAPP